MADNNKKSNFSSLSQGEGRGEALITGAEALMRSLEHQGVKTIFGYPARLAFVWLPVDRVLPILSRALQMP